MNIDALVLQAADKATSRRAALLYGATCRRRWTAEETEYLRANLGVKPVSEIAAALGRTELAIKIRWTRKGLTAPGKHKDYYSRMQVARILGVDVHAIMRLESEGLLEFHRIPGLRVGNGNDKRRIHSGKLRRWVTNPDNFIYFLYDLNKKPRRIPHAGYAKLIALASAKWGDEWWPAGKYAQYHKVSHSTMHQRIRRGKLRAVKWGNWWVRKSDVLADDVMPGKGSARKRRSANGN